MSGRTNPFTREELLEHARQVLAGHRSISGVCPQGSAIAKSTQYETDAMAAIVAMLEAYPLSSPASESVRVVCDDLETRGGFREVIAAMGPHDWRCVREHLAAKVAGTVVYAQPQPVEPDGEKLDFA